MSHPSNPWGPPQPVQPLPQPIQPSPYPTPGQAWTQPGMPPYGAPPRQRNGLAIAAIAISVVSLLASLGVVGFIAVSSAAGPSWVLQGEVRPSGSAVSAADLESALTRLVEDDGGSVDQIACPTSSSVGQGLVAVCHGSVDGLDWTGLVVFEDESGTFTVNQL